MTDANIRIVLALQRLDDVLSRFPRPSLAWLSLEEQHRHDSFSSGIRRRQFLCGRYLAREVISHIRGGSWNAYFLSAPDDGAPRITGQSGYDEFNTMSVSISHTDGWVACAISERPVGVDVQSRTKTRDITALSQMIGCDLSQEKNPSAKKLNRLFYANWGLREAWIKQSSDSTSASIPRFGPGHEADYGVGGLVGDIGDATLAIYPARLKAIEMTPRSVRVSEWTHWRPLSESQMLISVA